MKASKEQISSALKEYERARGKKYRSSSKDLVEKLFHGKVGLKRAFQASRGLASKRSARWAWKEAKRNPAPQLSEIYKTYIKSDAWKKKRREAFSVHGERCFECRATNDLRVHHLNYYRLGEECVETDLRVLCQMCHDAEHARIDGKLRKNNRRIGIRAKRK